MLSKEVIIRGGIGLKSMYRWSSFVFLSVVAGLMLSKGMDLRSIGTMVDGDGIGVSFLFFEINDRVPAHRIPVYAYGFLIAGLMTAAAALSVTLNTRVWKL